MKEIPLDNVGWQPLPSLRACRMGRASGKMLRSE